ncbi:MAG: MATE family efflux transporter [Candidatus Kapaibacterium sp.]
MSTENISSQHTQLEPEPEQTPPPQAQKRAAGHVDLLNGSYISTLVKFSIPLTLSFLINMAYSLIDRWFISRLGTDAIAAIGLGDQMNFLVFTLGSGFSMGTGIIVARRIGEGNREKANYTATQAIIFMLVTTVLLTVVLQLMLPFVLAKFGASPNVSALAQAYLSAILFGFSGNLLSFQINAIVRSTGNPVYPTIILVLTTVINAILAPIFIFVFNMGMYGAGLATASAQLIGCAINIYSIINGKAGIQLQLKGFRFDRAIIWSVLLLGIPSSIQMFSVSITRIAIFKMVAQFGENIMAAYTLGMNVDFIVFMFVFAVGVAVEIATGQNIGAKKFEGVFGYHKAGIKILLGVIAVLGTLIFFFGSHFTAMYSNNPIVIEETQKYFHVSVFAYLAFAVGIVSARVISGAGSAYFSLAIVAGSILLLQLPLIYILCNVVHWNQVGIWIGSAGGYGLFSIIALVSVYSKKWMQAKV